MHEKKFSQYRIHVYALVLILVSYRNISMVALVEILS